MGYRSNISVLVPTRGRPESMLALAQSFADTCTSGDTELHWIVDQNDPVVEDYRDAFHSSDWCGNSSFWVVSKGQPGIVHPLNTVAHILTFRPEKDENVSQSRVLGFMGDDHRPRTNGWDEAIYLTCRTMGAKIAYGDDLLQGENLPTAVFLTSNIVRELGFMAPPELRHLYVDDFWRDLGRNAGCLQYCPDIVIEHLHYSIGKASKDATYEQNNNSGSAKLDRVAWTLYKSSKAFQRDISTVKGLL